MRLVGLAVVLTLGLTLASLVAAAQQATGAIARIGYLALNINTSPHLIEAFRQGLRELGYVDGRNIVLEIRTAEGKLERLHALAAELVVLKVDVIVVGGQPHALAAKQATGTIPIVFVAVGDPVESGLVASLARPGGNVTGVSSVSLDLVGKRLEQLKQAVPGVSRVAVLHNPGERTEKDRLTEAREAEVAARAMGVRLQFVEARRPSDFDRAFSEIRARADALTVLGTSTFYNARGRLVDLAAKHRLPTMYVAREFVEALGLTIPQTLLLRADQVIQ